jgi:hypothetical protein
MHPSAAPAVPRLAGFRRWLGVALGAAAALCLGASWFLPWWNFQLLAPQYPKGLTLVIHLTGVQGDTAEIDTINHYIGMHSLADSALLERAASQWIVGALAAGAFLATWFGGRRGGAVALLLGMGLPVGFLLDTTYWMYHSGHDLDGHAPIHLKPFMPAVVGAGKVGQCRTEAWPAAGFWVAAVAVVLLAVAAWQRRRVLGGR